MKRLTPAAIVFAAWLFSESLPASAQNSSEWTRLTGCALAEGPHNDGDSIEVDIAGCRHVFRLYSVDCIEQNPRSTRRRQAQGRYFGIPTEGDALKFAREASAFTRESLSRPFTVITKWEPVTPNSDNPSVRAFVETADGEDLSERLVEEGLAIIRSGQALSDHPDGTSKESLVARLRSLETKARVAGRGAWSGTPKNPPLPPAPAGALVEATNTALLRASAGQTLKVHGRIASTGSLPDNRITFLNFDGNQRGDFVAIIRQPHLHEFLKIFPDGISALEGREVEISGPVTLYRDTPQIEISDPSQISFP